MATCNEELELKPLAQETLRHLLAIWLEFERRLDKVPIVRRIEQGTFSMQDYRELMCNLRAQVVEGARWITRAASSFTADFAELRSTVISHALDEHRDYELLERDFISIGGSLEEIRSTQRNIGTEALAAYLMQQASQPNPVDLLGAMFIIEGLGNKMASKWATRIQELLDIDESSTSFLSYHGQNDSTHMNKLYKILDSDALNAETAPRVLKTAKVVARLYALQLEELNHV